MPSFSGIEKDRHVDGESLRNGEDALAMQNRKGGTNPAAMTDTPLAVLLVEDNSGEAALLQRALSEATERMLLIRAATLAGALESIRQNAFDVILLDLSLPDSHGTATVKKVHAAMPMAPIIVLTGLDDDHMGIEAVREGAQDYLVKGKTETDVLVRAIRYAIERKRAEQALRDSEERHRTILDEMQEGVVFADADDIIRHANAFACTLLGTTREEVMGRPAASVHAESVRPAVTAILHDFRQGTRSDVVTVRRPLRDRELIFRFSPVRSADGRYWGIIVNIVDITDQIRMQQELAEARRMETLGRLAGGIAHEFNNLMATSLGLASHLRRKYSPKDPDYPTLTQIEQAADTAGRLAHQLLVYVKGGKIVPRVMNFSHVVTRAMEVCKPAVPPHVDFSVHMGGGLGDVECDATQVEQVIVNLCRNALDAMPTGGRLHVTADNARLVSLLAEASPPLAAGEYVWVAVEDTGCGMTPEARQRLFEPFFTTKPNGHGLALAAAWGIVKSHGGAITVATQPGQGSTFRVWLPRRGPD